MANIETIRNKYEPLKKIMDERTRRIWAAGEAKAIGWGGISTVATATGMSRTTITSAMGDLNALIEGKEMKTAKIRRSGGGRKRLIENDPTIIQDLELLLEPDIRGDPQSPLHSSSEYPYFRIHLYSMKHSPITQQMR